MHPPDDGTPRAHPANRDPVDRHPVNRLAHETSAYLRQHMHNPVDWYPWGPEALTRARDEQRPLLVSIGYSACHWCHVMERESFEDAATAAMMNRLFVNVKVDREERPDVDQIYMDAVVRLTGQGGWPLTAFCLPDGRPFHLGTYFPPEPRHGLPSFRQTLEAVDHAWRTQREAIERSATSIVAALQRRPADIAGAPLGATTLAAAAQEWMARADTIHGGFGERPKFPTPAHLDLLLAAADVLPAADARAAVAFVTFSVREMSRRGLYDQLGGGFHRYCVDDDWTIPHFEKMLYDQGQLLRTCAEAWRRTRDDELLWPIRETAAYLQREMSDADGGFFASQDADSEGAEGRFFVWRPEQIAAVLGDETARAFCAAYGVDARGNFEHGSTHLVDLARAPREMFANERAALFAARSKRIAPATDRKRVTAWNALAISGLARAGSNLGDDALLADAVAAAEFVLSRLQGEPPQPGPAIATRVDSTDGSEGAVAPDESRTSPHTAARLMRVFADGRAHVPAFLDDVAGMLEACLDLHRAGAGSLWLGSALRFAHDIVTRFFDATENDLLLVPADAEPLALRPRSDHDGATPHPAGLAVLGLVRAAALSGDERLARVAEAVLHTHAAVVDRSPAAFSTLVRAAALAERGPAVAVILGEPGCATTALLAARARLALSPEDHVVVHAPHALTPEGLDPAWIEGRTLVGGAPTAYLCRGTTCSLPATTAADVDAWRTNNATRSFA